MQRGRPTAVPRTERPPRLALRHSAALAVLAHMGFQGSASDETFKGYIKGLRKLGVPFTIGAWRPDTWLALYAYEHLMELAVTLSLRTYNILPDSLVGQLIAARPALVPLYDEAWRQCAKAPQSPVSFRGRDGTAHVAAGPYLDLQLSQRGRRFNLAGPPRLLNTAQAMEFYGSGVATAFLPGPIRISALVRAMATALEDPAIGASTPPPSPLTGRGLGEMIT